MSTSLERVNTYLETTQSNGFRRHLGASIIGRPCSRQLWYIFRWAWRVVHKGRILRLFERGHREEDALARYLRKSGIHVLQEDPDTGQQFRVEDHMGHFGGSLDSKLFDTPEYPMQWILGEYKTHNDKSFKAVKTRGVKDAKYEHFVQMQIYMQYEKLPAALYIAVNKNDDDLYMPIVEFDAEVAEKYIDRAHRIIFSEVPPPRLENASPGWYICRFCDYLDVCHHKRPKLKNCRTCVHSEPIENGQWECQKFQYILSEAEQRRGCLEHMEIPEE